MREGNRNGIGNRSKLGQHQSEETCRKISEATKGRIPWNKGKHGFSGYWTGKHHAEETLRKMSVAHKNQVPWNKGSSLSVETCRKMRLTHIARIEKNNGYCYPNYNPEACRLIEAYGQQHGFHFQHAENGGEFHIKELGYFVDGYDKVQNVVIEVDERWHYRNGKLLPRDLRRQREIEHHLGCTFVRIRI